MFRVRATIADLAPRGGLVAAAALLAAAGSAYAQDRGAEPAPTGPVVVLEADRVLRDADSNLVVAEGSVEARYQGRVLRASRLIYDTEKGTLRAQGGVEIVEPDGSIRYAEEIEVDEQLNSGVAVGFGARILKGGTVAANSAVLRPNGEIALSRAIYTACPVCAENATPTWTLRARRAEQDADSKMISYESVTLSVRGVPLIYLPYFAHPDPSAGRKSGLLMPEIGDSRRLGAIYRQPYYIAIGPSQDLTLTPSFHGSVDPILGARYRKRFWSGDLSLNASAGYAQDFDGEGQEFGDKTFRGHIFGGGAFTINDYWGWRFGVERASDDLYLSRYEVDLDRDKRGLYVGNPSRLLSQVNFTGQDEVSFAQISAVTGQGLRLQDDGDALPTVAPFGEAERLFRDPLFDGQLRLGLSTANVIREDNRLGSARITTQARWRKESLLGPGLVFSPFAEGRLDTYSVRPGDASETFTRTLGVGGVELRWPLVRPGAGMDVMIEPIAVAAYASEGGNDPRIPNEDSQSFELDETSIFRPVGTPNYDLWEPGGRVSLGVRATAQVGASEARATFARRWRTEDSPKTASGQPLFDRTTNLGEQQSDYVGVVALDFGRPLRADVRFRLDDENYKVNRLDAGVGGALGPLSADVRYFYVDDALRPNEPNHEVLTSAALALSKRWSVNGALRRDLNLDKNLLQAASLVYQDDCTFLEFTYQRQEADQRLGPNEGFRIRLGLKTLGFVGRQ